MPALTAKFRPDERWLISDAETLTNIEAEALGELRRRTLEGSIALSTAELSAALAQASQVISLDIRLGSDSSIELLIERRCAGGFLTATEFSDYVYNAAGQITSLTRTLYQPDTNPANSSIASANLTLGVSYYFRSYGPTTGRYTQGDPIGLNGGWSRYGYVDANPLRYSDAHGLSPVAGGLYCAKVGSRDPPEAVVQRGVAHCRHPTIS